MLDSVIAYIGEVFLDAVIDKSQSIKISKKKRIIYTINHICLFDYLFISS